MSNRCPQPLAAIVTVVCLFIPCLAQTTEVQVVKGGLQSSGTLVYRDLWVELLDITHHTEVHRADVTSDGSFEFRSVPPGDYRFRVTSNSGEPIYEQSVTISTFSGQLSIQMPVDKRPRYAPGTVSFTQLKHPPSQKAFQALASAQKFSEAGNIEKAVEELERAIRLSPEYADAYNNLAVQHMHMGRYDDAATELARAIEIAGPSTLKLCNLAYAQSRLNREEEAISNLRAALKLDSSYPQAHLILGSILAADPRTRAESIPHLERAALTLPSARATLETLRRAQQE